MNSITNIPQVREREPGKFVRTGVTNELARALNGLQPSIGMGQIRAPMPWPTPLQWGVIVQNTKLPPLTTTSGSISGATSGTTNNLDGGIYAGYLLTPPTTPLALTTGYPVQSSAVGTYTGDFTGKTDWVYFVNSGEVTMSAHSYNGQRVLCAPGGTTEDGRTYYTVIVALPPATGIYQSPQTLDTNETVAFDYPRWSVQA